MTKTVKLMVSGTVQGVGYRQALRSVARGWDLVGWVRNLADGRVEALVQGESEAVERLVDWAWSGPAGASVTGVESDVVAPDPNLADFNIHPGPAKGQ